MDNTDLPVSKDVDNIVLPVIEDRLCNSEMSASENFNYYKIDYFGSNTK